MEVTSMLEECTACDGGDLEGTRCPVCHGSGMAAKYLGGPEWFIYEPGKVRPKPEGKLIKAKFPSRNPLQAFLFAILRLLGFWPTLCVFISENR